MRCHRTFHVDANNLIAYLSKDGELMGSTVPGNTTRQKVAFLGAFAAQHGCSLVHMVMSMQKGQILPLQDWLEVGNFVLTRSGIAPFQTPWLIIGREQSSCDHIHILSATKTYLGRPLEIRTSERATHQLHCDVAQMLALPEPSPWVDGKMTLAPNRKSKDPTLTDFVRATDESFKSHQPRDLPALNKVLAENKADWQLIPDPNKDGMVLAHQVSTARNFNPRRAGSHYSSRRIFQRLTFSARLSLAQKFISLLQLMKQLPQSIIEFVKTKGANRHDKNSFSTRHSDPQNRRDAKRRSATSPSSGAAELGHSAGRDELDRIPDHVDRSPGRSTDPDSGNSGEGGPASRTPGEDVRPKCGLTFGSALQVVLEFLKRSTKKHLWRATATGVIIIEQASGVELQLHCTKGQVVREPGDEGPLAEFFSNEFGWPVVDSQLVVEPDQGGPSLDF